MSADPPNLNLPGAPAHAARVAPAAQAAYAADGAACSREAFYTLACDPQRSVVVEACAGAGKTWLLVSRILRALLAGAAPHEILAITFTRKAAGEMRERLDDWLAEFAQAAPERQAQELVWRGLTPTQAAAMAPRLGALHEQVLAAGRPVAINTFHAWFSQLMRAAPHELLDPLGLQPGMALLEDTSVLLPALMRRFQATVLADDDLTRDYTALLQRHGRSRLADWLAAALERRIEIEMADEQGVLASSVLPAATLWPDCAGLAEPLARLRSDAGLRGVLDQAARALGAQSAKRAQDAGQALQQALQLAADASDADVFDQAWAALFTKGGEPRKLGDCPPAEAAVAALLQLLDQRAQQQAHDDHQAMVRLLRVLLAAWRQLKRQRALADMNDLERCALLLLSDPVASGWVQQRLDARVRHLLIDEFQDTSPLQWHALYGWLSGYAGSGGGGQAAPAVFIVGDPKQSIYRFRRAEPRVFGAARDFVVQALGGVVLSCDHTRRNSPGVIDLLNAVFEPAAQAGEMAGYRHHTTEVPAQAEPALRTLPVVPRPASSRFKPATRWRDSLTEPRDAADELLRLREAAWVADAIAALVRDEQVAPGQVMVLARKRQTLGLVAQALRERALACSSPEALPLASLPEAADLIALLDVLASPGHDLSLAQALKCPVFSVDDAQLLALARRAREAQLPWWHALQRWAEAPAALAAAARQLAGWAQAAQGLPPHDLLDRVVHQGDVLARMVAAAAPERRGLARHAVQALLAQALALDGGRYVSLYSFVRALRTQPLQVPLPAAPEVVQLLTVHGAKGLEADVVLLVDTDPQRPQTSRPGVLVDWPVDQATPASVALLAQMNRCPPTLRDLDALEQRLGEREQMNLLYVAMTRARRLLVLSCTEPHQAPPGPSWWSRLQALGSPWRPASAMAAAAPAAGAPFAGPVPELVQVPALPDNAAALAAQRQAAPVTRPEAAREEAAARLGQAVHRWLEWAVPPLATGGTPTAWADALSAAAGGGLGDAPGALARAAAAEFGLPPVQAAAVQRLGRQLLSQPELQRFFDPAGLVWAGNEVPVAADGQVLRIDRLVQLRGADGQPGGWWVLDYKLHRAPDQVADNLAQLSRYRQLLAAQLPGQVVSAAFITAGGRLVPLAPG